MEVIGTNNQVSGSVVILEGNEVSCEAEVVAPAGFCRSKSTKVDIYTEITYATLTEIPVAIDLSVEGVFT